MSSRLDNLPVNPWATPVGRRPMFDTGVVLLEVFLFDFTGDLYDRSLDVR